MNNNEFVSTMQLKIPVQITLDRLYLDFHTLLFPTRLKSTTSLNSFLSSNTPGSFNQDCSYEKSYTKETGYGKKSDTMSYVDDTPAFRIVAQITVQGSLVGDSEYSRLFHVQTEKFLNRCKNQSKSKSNPIHRTGKYLREFSDAQHSSTPRVVERKHRRKLTQGFLHNSDKEKETTASLHRFSVPVSCVLQFTCHIADLPLNASLKLFIFCIDSDTLVAYGSIPLFNSHGMYPSGSCLVPLITHTHPTFKTEKGCHPLKSVSSSHLIKTEKNQQDTRLTPCLSSWLPQSSDLRFSASNKREDLVCFGRLLYQNWSNTSKAVKRCKTKYVDAQKQSKVYRLCLATHNQSANHFSDNHVESESDSLMANFDLLDVQLFKPKASYSSLATRTQNETKSSSSPSWWESDDCSDIERFDTLDKKQSSPSLLHKVLVSPPLINSQSRRSSSLPSPWRSSMVKLTTKKSLIRESRCGVKVRRQMNLTPLIFTSRCRNANRFRKSGRKRRIQCNIENPLDSFNKSIYAAMTNYSKLNALQNDLSPDNIQLNKLCYERLRWLCQKNIVESFPYVGYIAVEFPITNAPVLFSRAIASDVVYPSHEITWKDVQALFSRHSTLESNDFINSPSSTLRCNSLCIEFSKKRCQEDSDKVHPAMQDGSFLRKVICRWFLHRWNPFRHSFQQSLLLLSVQSCYICKKNRVDIYSARLLDKTYRHPINWVDILYTLCYKNVKSENLTLICRRCVISCGSKVAGQDNKVNGQSLSLFCQFGSRPMQYLSGSERIHYSYLPQTVHHYETSPIYEKTHSRITSDSGYNLADTVMQQGVKLPRMTSVEDSRTRYSKILAQKVLKNSQAVFSLPGLHYDEIKRALYLASLPEPSSLDIEDRRLLWASRHILKSKGVGLYKLSVVYASLMETENSMEKKDLALDFSMLLKDWPIPSLDCILELLSPLSKNSKIRELAVKALELLADDKLVLFIPQLIQALRYERGTCEKKSLLNFLIERSVCSPQISSLVYWNLQCETDDTVSAMVYSEALSRFVRAFTDQTSTDYMKKVWNILENQVRIVKSLRHIASQIHGKWDRAESKTLRLQELLATQPILAAAQENSRHVLFHDKRIEPGNLVGYDNATGQDRSASSPLSFSPNNAKLFEDENLLQLKHPIPLPISPHYHFLSIVAEKSYTMRSSQYPLLLAFRILKKPSLDMNNFYLQEVNQNVFLDRYQNDESGMVKDRYAEWFMSEKELKARGYREEIKLYLYKSGDDLRQDQLVMQLMSLCDTFLSYYGCHRCLLRYQVSAFSKMDGMIEFIENSQPISSVKRTHLTIKEYFKSLCVENAKLSYSKLINTFIKTCSGCSVATFLLGVGDRHLDNILITNEGQLFHVDFGFILDDDPKPFRPPMKLCREMIETLGGPESESYEMFQLLCCQYFSCFRRHAKMIIDMLHMMTDSGIRALRRNPLDILAKVKERLQLHLSESEAEAYLLNVISISAGALFPAVVDKLHEWAVYWK